MSTRFWKTCLATWVTLSFSFLFFGSRLNSQGSLWQPISLICCYLQKSQGPKKSQTHTLCNLCLPPSCDKNLRSSIIVQRSLAYLAVHHSSLLEFLHIKKGKKRGVCTILAERYSQSVRNPAIGVFWNMIKFWFCHVTFSVPTFYTEEQVKNCSQLQSL